MKLLVAVLVLGTGVSGPAAAAETVLMVTWLTNPPHSYQARFASTKTCEAARAKVLADRQRLAAENEKPLKLSPTGGTIFRGPPPQVTALCTPR